MSVLEIGYHALKSPWHTGSCSANSVMITCQQTLCSMAEGGIIGHASSFSSTEIKLSGRGKQSYHLSLRWRVTALAQWLHVFRLVQCHYLHVCVGRAGIWASELLCLCMSLIVKPERWSGDRFSGGPRVSATFDLRSNLLVGCLCKQLRDTWASQTA